MIEKIVTYTYIIITLLFPLKYTYSALRYKSKESQLMLAVYWAFYSFFTFLQQQIDFMKKKPFQFGFILLAVWLYNDQYKGGLLLAQFIKEKIGKSEKCQNIVNIISKIPNLFEITVPYQQGKLKEN